MVREVIAETGAVAGKQRRALDSTVLDDAVARQDTVTQLIAQIRRVGREVPGAKDLIAARVHPAGRVDRAGLRRDREAADRVGRPGRPRRAGHRAGQRRARPARRARLSRRSSKAGGKPAEAVALLALVAGQDVEPAEDSDGTDGRWRIARKTAPDRVISTVDPDARHAHKTRERRQDGFKAHVVVEPDTGLTTVCELTKTNGAGQLRCHRRRRTRDRRPHHRRAGRASGVEVLGDSAYATGDMLHSLNGKQWTPLLKPWPLKPAVRGGFTIDDFTHDTAAGTLTCPAGITRTASAEGQRHLRRRLPRLPATRAVHHLEHRPHRAARRARPAATRAPQTSHRRGLPGHLPPAPARWSNAPSPGSPEATDACPTAGSRRTTTGSTTASPPSTCADSSPWASPSTTEPGPWPEPDQPGPTGVCAAHHGPTMATGGRNDPVVAPRVLTQTQPLDGPGGVPPAAHAITGAEMTPCSALS